MSAGRAHPKLSKAQSFPLSAEDHGAAQYWRPAAHHNSAPHLPSAHIRHPVADRAHPSRCTDHEDTDWTSAENGLIQRKNALIRRKTELLERSRSDVQARATKGC